MWILSIRPPLRGEPRRKKKMVYAAITTEGSRIQSIQGHEKREKAEQRQKVFPPTLPIPLNRLGTPIQIQRRGAKRRRRYSGEKTKKGKTKKGGRPAKDPAVFRLNSLYIRSVTLPQRPLLSFLVSSSWLQSEDQRRGVSGASISPRVPVSCAFFADLVRVQRKPVALPNPFPKRDVRVGKEGDWG